MVGQRSYYQFSIRRFQNKLSYVELVQRTCITVKPGIDFVSRSGSGDTTFQRFFICFQASAYGFEVGCRPMLFLDETHIKEHRVQGVILAVSALNGNNELFNVAYSITDSETYDNWVWFLENLKKALLSDRRMAFLLDRGKGLKEAVPDIFPIDHHGYRFQHIMQNFNDQCVGKYAAPFKKLLRKILQRIAYAVTEQEYQDAMMAMELNYADAKEWVLQNDVDHWSHARFLGQRFGELLAESFNNWIHDARSLPILQMVDKIRVQMMEMAAKRKIDAALWDTPYCPKVQKIIEKNLQERRSLAICHSDGIKFEVIKSMKTYAVDLHLQTCSCGHWQLVKIPCKHACAAIGSNNEAVSQYDSAFYSTEVYKAAYERNIQPIPTFDMPDPASTIRCFHQATDNKKVAWKTEKEENTFKRRSRSCVYLFKVQTNRSQPKNL
ncbi:hypothetical protein Taro_034611 [Colocasia esculenta]|uniref:SWIM-type domain-containing protein n=1 Tax=Colocasia esculenta TaxID=4460 RepID=A0A843VRW3_COLES|nr:hypothetical protein [Colocasia esculenta]